MNAYRILILAGIISIALPAQSEVERDVVYGHKDGMALIMDVYRPSDNANGAGVAYMISGGWESNLSVQQLYEASFFSALVDAGYTVFAVRHGSSPRYVVTEAFDDVFKAFQFVGANAREYGVDPDRLGVSGPSAGGHLSLMLGLKDSSGESVAATYRPAAVVAYMPPTDLSPFVGGQLPALSIDEADAPGISPIQHVSNDDPPVLLVHGDADALVPLSESENILELLREAGVTSELVVIEGAGHGPFTGEGGEIAKNAMLRWFSEYLGVN